MRVGCNGGTHPYRPLRAMFDSPGGRGYCGNSAEGWAVALAWGKGSNRSIDTVETLSKEIVYNSSHRSYSLCTLKEGLILGD
eukprot:761544-Hanusia_phi.AAC.4